MTARFLPALAATSVALLLAIAPGSAAAQQFTAAAGNVTIKLTFPAGVAKAKGILLFTQRGLASGWAGSAPFAELAKKIEAPLAILSGGDDLNDPSYPNRCKSGEFNNITMALEKMAMMSNHPELAHAPLIGLGHSHGGDYWNWYNACHPEKMAMVFVHASGGVNYSAASLKVPVFYTLNMNDLVENGSGKPRAGMFVNRAKGAPMTLLLAEGGHDTQFTATGYQMVTAIIEGIFRMRVPADADAAKGPVLLADIVEGETTWVSDLYAKEISTYAAFKGNKALTSFFPNEALATMWKGSTAPALPKSIMLPSDTCSWCGKPNDEPKATPGAPPINGSPASDGGAPTGSGGASGESPDAAAPSGSGGSSGSGSGGSAGTPTPSGSGGATGGSTSTPNPPSSGSGGAKATPKPDPVDEPSPPSCTMALTPANGSGALALLLAATLVALVVRPRSRRRR
jgi:hypothetical protein